MRRRRPRPRLRRRRLRGRPPPRRAQRARPLAPSSRVRRAAAASGRRRARGTERPQQLKATVSFDGGFLGEAELSYAGTGAEERARMANQIVEERLRHVHGIQATLRCDLIGISSLHSTACQYGVGSKDVRIRCAIRTPDRKEAENLLWEVESLLCCGPAGGGGYRGNIRSSVLTYTTYVDRTHVSPRLDIIDV